MRYKTAAILSLVLIVLIGGMVMSSDYRSQVPASPLRLEPGQETLYLLSTSSWTAFDHPCGPHCDPIEARFQRDVA
jgi:hypothetical protein